MKEERKNAKTTKTDFPNTNLNLNEIFESENLSNAKNDSKNYGYNEINDIISNRIDQYTSENINLLLMLNRAYYVNELVKIERYLDTLDYINSKSISKVDEKRLTFCFNRLSKLEFMYISLENYYKSLQLQKRIINLVKQNIINNNNI